MSYSTSLAHCTHRGQDCGCKVLLQCIRRQCHSPGVLNFANASCTFSLACLNCSSVDSALGRAGRQYIREVKPFAFAKSSCCWLILMATTWVAPYDFASAHVRMPIVPMPKMSMRWPLWRPTCLLACIKTDKSSANAACSKKQLSGSLCKWS